jgi:hypothetical protein
MPRAMATAERLAEAVSLDMISHWTPTVRTYLGRITKPHILTAVREGVSNEAADRMADMKKQDMAEAAEQLLVLAACVVANAANRARVSRASASGICDGSEGHQQLLRRCRVAGMAGTAYAAPLLWWNHRKSRPRARRRATPS